VALAVNARAEILAAIRAAVGPPQRVIGPDGLEAPPSPARAAPDLLDLFCKRAGDYEARITRTDPHAVANALAEVAARHEAKRLVAPPGLPALWRPAEVEIVEDDRGLSARELERFDGALTGAGLAIAETGTIVLDGGPDQGRRLLTLLPDLHICVVPQQRIVADVADAIAAVGDLVRAERRAVTLVSGPSATADIELRRVNGVHGPRRLEVVVVAGA
jgi:L-lactate dehydrogenase complex protein LldG